MRHRLSHFARFALNTNDRLRCFWLGVTLSLGIAPAWSQDTRQQERESVSNRLTQSDRIAPGPGPEADVGRNGVARIPLAVGTSRHFERPAPPNEFQKFVEAATGQLLPVFGSRFFLEAARPDFRIDNVPVSADYTVGPGDEIIVRVWGSVDADLRSTVDRDGRLNLPRIGSFTVAGTKASDLEAQLRHQIARLYNNFQLSVSLGQLRAVKVFVVGPARRPGVYALPSQSTLLSAAVVAGGPGPNGSMRRIVLRRRGQVVSEVDMYGSWFKATNPRICNWPRATP